MTDEQIVKALECCKDNDGCNKCPYGDIFSKKCINLIQKNALDLIKRQQADKERLEIELQAMRGAANSYKSRVQTLELEIEYLKADKEALINGQLTLQKMYLESRAEAVREFAERLKERRYFMRDEKGIGGAVVFIEKIDSLVKEMTEKEGGNG